MKRISFIIIGIMAAIAACTTKIDQVEDAQSLIGKVVDANGGADALHTLKDISFEYTFRINENNTEDVSIERYIFDGEVSYGQYSKRQCYALPQISGTHTQFFDGTKTISKVNGDVLTDQKPAYIGHALRKTNYYWFAMMFKLQDPGVNHKLLPEREVNGISYKVVEMTFGENIGETSDKYILYINPETYRIDQFLYTALGFGVKEPSLMELEYEEINGIYLSTYRRYAPADWEGNLIKEAWTEQITEKVKFNNGFDLRSIQNLL